MATVTHTSFAKAFQAINKRVTTSLYQSVNRGMSSGRSLVVRETVKHTKINRDIVSARIGIKKVSARSPFGRLGLGIKVGISLGKFNPQVESIVTSKGRRRKGVSVEIAGQRTTVSGAWLATAKNGKVLVLGRKGAFSGNVVKGEMRYTGATTKRYNTIGLRYGRIGEWFEANTERVKKRIVEQAQKNLGGNLKRNVSKLK